MWAAIRSVSVVQAADLAQRASRKKKKGRRTGRTGFPCDLQLLRMTYPSERGFTSAGAPSESRRDYVS